jgi:carboxylate-amine ligase
MSAVAAAGAAEVPMTIEHAYGSSTPYSLGVEEEFQLVNAESFELVPRVEQILADATDTDLLRIKQELMQSVIEVATDVCSTPAQALGELTDLRRRLGELANTADCRLASAGTHPFSRYEFQKVTEKERYQDIISRLQWIAQRELIFGLHVHVGIDSPEKMIGIFNTIRSYLPHLLALSANSPFWQGRHTGLMSNRIKVFDPFPRSGMPEPYESWEAWTDLMTRAMRAGAMDDYTYVWWDVRPHPRFGTIEIRVCDAQTRVRDSIALAALIQATCAWLGDKFERGTLPPVQPTFLIEENKWSAARYGLDGTFLDFADDSVVPTREAVKRLVDSVAPFAVELGSERELAWVEELIDENGAARQLRHYDQSESLTSVAKMLVEDTAAPAT